MSLAIQSVESGKSESKANKTVWEQVDDLFEDGGNWKVSLKLFVSANDNITEDNYHEAFVSLENFTDFDSFSADDLESVFIDELTFCASFKPLVLLRQTLVSIKDYLVVTLLDLELGLIMIELDYVEYVLKVGHSLLPQRWYRLCFLIGQSMEINVVFDGKLTDTERIMYNWSFSLVDINQAGLTFGYNLEDDQQDFSHDMFKENKFHGQITGVAFWSNALSLSEIVDLTDGQSCAKNISTYGVPDLFNWESLRHMNISNTASSYFLLVDVANEICNQVGLDVPMLYPVKGNYDESRTFCQSLGGSLTVPESDKNIEDIDRIEPKYVLYCNSKAWLGIRKDNRSIGSYIDDKNNNVTFLDYFDDGQPNGKEFEQCISYRDLWYHDERCKLKTCSICDVNLDKAKFVLRGNLILSNDLIIDRDYSPEKSRYFVLDRFVGSTGSMIHLSSGEWFISVQFIGPKGNKVANLLDRSGQPLGLGHWKLPDKVVQLKLTQCRPGIEFTCHNFGQCIPIKQRCDGKYDCGTESEDFSDEEHCHIVNVDQESYNNENPPKGSDDDGGKLEVEVKMRVDSILDIDELSQRIVMKLMLRLSWYDDQLSYSNLREEHKFNIVRETFMYKVWTPTLVFLNHVGDELIEALPTSVMSVERMGNYSPNSLKEIYENLEYSGKENPLLLRIFNTIDLHCKFDLSMFPFDKQTCPFGLIVPGFLEPHVDIKLVDLDAMYEDIHLNQYEFIKFDQNDKTTEKGRTIKSYLKLRRITTYYLASTFVPTLCLIIVSEMTLFINEVHFEATIMVALTTMLVMYTLFQGVGISLPHTAYLKMIDIWLLAGLIIPFVVIVILIAKDSLNSGNVQEKNKKKTIINWMQRLVPIFTGFFVLGYTMIALRSYNQSF